MSVKEWFHNSVQKMPKIFGELKDDRGTQQAEIESKPIPDTTEEYSHNQLVAILFSSVNQEGEIKADTLSERVRQQLAFSRFEELMQDEEIQSKIQNLQRQKKIEEMEQYAKDTTTQDDDERVEAVKANHLRLVQYYDKIYIKEIPHLTATIDESPMSAVPFRNESFLKQRWIAEHGQEIPPNADGWLVEKNGVLQYLSNEELTQYDVCDIYGDSIVSLEEFNNRRGLLQFNTLEEQCRFFEMLNSMMTRDDITARLQENPSFFRYIPEERRGFFAELAVEKEPFNIFYVSPSHKDYQRLVEIAVSGNPATVGIVDNSVISKELSEYISEYSSMLQIEPKEISTVFHIQPKEQVLSAITKDDIKDIEKPNQRIYRFVDPYLETELAEEELDQLIKKEPLLQKKIAFERIGSYIAILKQRMINEADTEQKAKIEQYTSRLEEQYQAMEKDCTTITIKDSSNPDIVYPAIPIVGKTEFWEAEYTKPFILYDDMTKVLDKEDYHKYTVYDNDKNVGMLSHFVYDYFTKYDEGFRRMYSNQMEMVKQDGLNIQFVRSPSPEMCMEAVKQNGLALQYIEDQTQELCEAAAQENWEAVKYIKNTKIKEKIIIEADNE